MNPQQTMVMAELIRKRRDVMVGILKASIAQEQALGDGLIEPLVARLNDKQTLIEDLRDLQEQLKPFADQTPEDREWPSEVDRENCRRAIEETERLQGAILEIDARCERVMIERRNEIFDSLNRATDAATVAKAYAGGVTSKPAGGSIDFSSG